MVRPRCAVAGTAIAAHYSGRPIATVLAELRGPGLDFIYSSELLPPSLTVAEEPTSTNRLVIARERASIVCSPPLRVPAIWFSRSRAAEAA